MASAVEFVWNEPPQAQPIERAPSLFNQKFQFGTDPLRWRFDALEQLWSWEHANKRSILDCFAASDRVFRSWRSLLDTRRTRVLGDRYWHLGQTGGDLAVAIYVVWAVY
jgi:hypothetical protein